MSNLSDLIKNYQDQKILLIGDIMLDRFVYGAVSRISPEGPIPVLSAAREETMLGGAGNVFANLNGLGCDVRLLSVVGKDSAAAEIKEIITTAGGDISGLIEDISRPTILKTRFLSQNQQLLRVDNEKSVEQTDAMQRDILSRAETLIEEMKVLILSDYGKGMLAPWLIRKLIRLAKKNKVPVIVDPKGKDFSIYSGASIVTPNKKELSEATNGHAVSSDENIEGAGKALIKQSGIETIFATRSEDGMSVVSKKGPALHLDTVAQEVFDVSGAGDTVVAAIAASIATGATYEQAAQIANVAGGIAVAKVGTAIIRQNELIKEVNDVAARAAQKPYGISMIADQEIAREKIKAWQAQGLKVGFTNGCFDIVHYGHVNYLNQARDKCDRLVVGMNHDKSVRILKGESRPINDEIARATVIAALGAVDMVVFFGAENSGADNTPCVLVDVLRPDILMKGGDYTIDQLPEGKVVLAYGGEVDIMPLYDGYSTTNIIKKSAES
jgi:D-beta-D-heptose 7-phosphate kinase/D-beta-D-heptose 1-phosphate adenosyltransferase